MLSNALAAELEVSEKSHLIRVLFGIVITPFPVFHSSENLF